MIERSGLPIIQAASANQKSHEEYLCKTGKCTLFDPQAKTYQQNERLLWKLDSEQNLWNK